jgi:hypothetical protein
MHLRCYLYNHNKELKYPGPPFFFIIFIFFFNKKKGENNKKEEKNNNNFQDLVLQNSSNLTPATTSPLNFTPNLEFNYAMEKLERKFRENPYGTFERLWTI